MQQASDYERLEQLLDDLATPISRWHTARAKLVKQLQHPTPRALANALDAERHHLDIVHALVINYQHDELEPALDEQALLRQGFDPETMIMESDGSITR